MQLKHDSTPMNKYPNINITTLDRLIVAFFLNKFGISNDNILHHSYKIL